MTVPVDTSPTRLSEPSAPSNGVQMLADEDRICWVEVKQYPYQPDHQVELLHLQAEADALLVQLQAIHQKRLANQV